MKTYKKPAISKAKMRIVASRTKSAACNSKSSHISAEKFSAEEFRGSPMEIGLPQYMHRHFSSHGTAKSM